MTPVECPGEPWFDPATANDDCDPNPVITFNDVTVQGNCPGEYSVTRTWKATDNCGNTATCSKTISIEDNTPPSIHCPSVMTPVECPGEPWFDPATASDLCDPHVTITHEDVTVQGNCPGAYSVTRTWTARDDCGNTATCSKTISIEDNTPPSIHCASVMTPVECPGEPWFDPASAYDDCDPNVTVTHEDVTTQGNCPVLFSVTRIWTATDDCGNTATCSRTIDIEDNTAPSISCPQVVSPIECPHTPSFGMPTANDECDANVDITFNDNTTQGQCDQEFVVTRVWTATDDCGNTAICSQTIQVKDNTPPVITCPNVASPIECPDMPDFGDATADDACDPNPTITFDDNNTPGDCDGEYSVTRTWTATDDCGNSSTCSKTISVEDNTPPEITCPNVVPMVECPGLPNFGQPTIDDACDPQPGILFTDVTTPGDCPAEYTVTRTWTTTDECGNSASCSATISVVDIAPPVLVGVPANITVQCNFNPPPPPVVTADDACDGQVDVVFNESQSPGSCPILDVITRTWTATDECGNSTAQTQIIQVVDTQGPVITMQPEDVLEECSPDTPQNYQDWLDSQGGADAEDCGDVTWTYTNTPGDFPNDGCAGTFYSYIRFIATDQCGNTSYADARFLVIDTEPPVFVSGPYDHVRQCEPDCDGETELYNWLDTLAGVQIMDNCSEYTLYWGLFDETEGCGRTFSKTYFFRATDQCGNSVTKYATFNYVDTVPPYIVECPPGDDNLTCEFDVPPPNPDAVVAIDECGLVEADVIVEDIFSYGNGCGYFPQTVIYTYAAVDSCGNKSICYQSFQIVDTLPPVYFGPDTIDVACIGDLPNADQAIQILLTMMEDNCYEVICFNDGIQQADSNVVTYTFKAKDLCVNWTEPFDVTFIATGDCKPLCSFTPDTWSSGATDINGDEVQDILNVLFGFFGPVEVGRNHRTITVEDPDCISVLLPGDGPSPEFVFGNFVANAANGCTLPPHLQNLDGTLSHGLAAQTMALELNLRYNLYYNGRFLGYQPIKELPECIFTEQIMDVLGPDATIQNLLVLANNYMAGIGYFTPQFGEELADAVAMVNMYWENCGESDPCDDNSNGGGTGNEGNEITNVFFQPNPADQFTALSFTASSEMPIHIWMTSGSGAVLFESNMDAVTGVNVLDVSLWSVPPGVYTVFIQSPNQLETVQLVKVAE